MRRKQLDDLVILALATLVVLADQWTKSWVRSTLPVGVPWNPVPWLRPILSFTHVTNEGAAFGMLPQLKPVFPFISLAVCALMFYFYRPLAHGRPWITISLGLQLGGTLGNLIDRLTQQGRVTDFLDLNFWPLQDWPVFNIADSSVVVSVCILAAVLLLEKDLLQENPPAQPT
ncbi:MAG TPA: signal peptidase II [Anaerolineae bacterium]|nr:signal peptidase II [Anaerolineae bacterium]HOU24419.1 signal peptidase II [Anaerolineae bacterium]HQJ52769.1 signal peptidase II [Anaerolineae bacterium]